MSYDQFTFYGIILKNQFFMHHLSIIQLIIHRYYLKITIEYYSHFHIFNKIIIYLKPPKICE